MISGPGSSGTMDDINDVDPNVSMSRLRTLVWDGNDVAKVQELSKVELIDMLFAAACGLAAIDRLLPPGLLYTVMSSDFSDVGSGGS